jgi:hypothetical protein
MAPVVHAQEATMATIQKEFSVKACPDATWDAVRDFAAVHTRLAPGFVVDAKVDGDTRTVTFGNGMVAQEQLVACDDKSKRLVYRVVGGQFQHDNASVQIVPEGDYLCRFIWTRDMLPDQLAGPIEKMMDQACVIMQKALEKAG